MQVHPSKHTTMFGYIKKKLARNKIKKNFDEYGFEIKTFKTEKYGTVDFAKWLHPFEAVKTVSDENIDFYRQFVKQGDTAIDIGAHSGDTSVPMAVAAGSTGCVLALEPNKYVFKILVENAALNKDKTNIVPLCLAATDKDGKFTFHYSDASFCNGGNLSSLQTKERHHKYTLEVEGVNLENYLEKNHKDRLLRLTLIKIDAEGYDKEIIKSIPHLLKTYRPYMISECLRILTEQERYDLYDTIASNGYNLYYLTEVYEKVSFAKGLIKMQRQDMLKWKHFDILCVPVEKSV